MPIPTVDFHWLDRNGKKAQSRVRFGGGHAPADIFPKALSLAAALEPASTCYLARIEVTWRHARPDAIPPGPSSDVKRRLILFYRNADYGAFLPIPSPMPLPVDTAGPYRNVRLQLTVPPVPAILAGLAPPLALTLIPGEHPWPIPCVAGGFIRYAVVFP